MYHLNEGDTPLVSVGFVVSTPRTLLQHSRVHIYIMLSRLQGCNKRHTVPSVLYFITRSRSLEA